LLPKTSAGFEIGKQLIRSSGSVGANYRASGRAKSKKDFIYKIEVVLEEADESHYWLQTINEAELLPGKETDSLISEAEELVRIFHASDKTAKSNTTKSPSKKPAVASRKKINRSTDQ
jgi:four helix bundle protein